MKNLLLACCSCSPRDIPCKQCNSNLCACNPPEESKSQTPVTSINVEVSNLDVEGGTSRGATDVSYAHFWAKELQNINENGLTGLKNRPVLDNNNYLGNGIRYGDAFGSGDYKSKLTGCSVGSRIGTTPQDYSPLDVPCAPPADSSNPDQDLGPACWCPIREDSEWPCRDLWCEYFEQMLTQGFAPQRTWNWHPDTCSAQTLGGTNFTLEFDWPCIETQAAFDRAQAKYDFGQQRVEQAQSFCADNPQDEKCGNGSSCGWLCHPAAKDEIGAQPPSLVPCIETCPSQYPQAVCDYDNEVKYPSGTVEPFGDFVSQEIGCVTGLDGDEGCSFQTKVIGQNHAARRDCTHQCGQACGGQRCCDIDCFQDGCCDQLLYNPLTGETVDYNENGCIVDEDGKISGGWKIEPNANGEYERCSKPLSDCLDADGNLVAGGCRRDLDNGGIQNCNGAGCCPSGSGVVGGDVRSWEIPRLVHPVLSRKAWGTTKPPQGIYSRHCPDTIDPFVPRDSRFMDPEKCSNLNAPTFDECKGGPNVTDDCEYPDKHCIWRDDHNPRGMICYRGICTPAVSWNNGLPVHECYGDDPGWQDPATHNRAFCGDNPCEDLILIENDTTGDPRGCDRSGCWPDCKRDVSGLECSDCYPFCTAPIMATYTSGTNEYEMGLQHVSIACRPSMLEEEYTIWDGVFNDWAQCAEGPPRQLYNSGSMFVVATEWFGGGDTVIDYNQVGRIGSGTYSLSQSAEMTNNNCIFGTYDRLVEPSTGWIVGGPDLPFISDQARCTDWADVHSSCYYPYVGPLKGLPDCSDLASQRVSVEYRVPSSIPTVFIT